MFKLHRQLSALAGMSDSEFLSRMDELRAHPSTKLRAICAQRWAKITFPNKNYLDVEDDAWLVWGSTESRV